jgi:hypothetical protein
MAVMVLNDVALQMLEVGKGVGVEQVGVRAQQTLIRPLHPGRGSRGRAMKAKRE